MMGQVHYVTAEGLDKLKKELNDMITVQRPAISKAIGEARDKGDLSENAEYDAAREAQGMLELKISQIQTLIATAKIIDESKLDTSKVGMLNKVKVKNLKTGKDMEFTLVGESEANLAEGKLAASTPIGKALMGRKKGETVEVNAPAGLIKFQILDISI
ncbi:MAG TPA: transcription elongation factor GreA [Candidatus Egerieousia sp.]|nr:transcription elongation factor GreA [Candidatus Egerieousia sp.]HPT05514.1 transcription elongation factor GreA [Candidatus Egerieousia sp.]